MILHRYLEETTPKRTDHIAVEDPRGGSMTYGELSNLADALRNRLAKMGVQVGDRVGICSPKCIDTVTTVFGILKTGAAYVPVDPSAPPSRNAYIFNDCAVKVVIVEKRLEPALRAELTSLGSNPFFLVVDLKGGGLSTCLREADRQSSADSAPTVFPPKDSLAYILYTSGSTGKPKGVMLSHENATSFVDWCSEVFQPQAEDRFSSHAPFHFDLSILDLYVPIKHGATVVLIPEEMAREPIGLANLIAEKRISMWYSAPSILSMLAQYGQMEKYDYSAVKMVLFAGEVFPIVHLRRLKQKLPHPRYFNLYGPTETNVCTYYEVPNSIAEDRTEPYPIGKVCSHLDGLVVDSNDGSVTSGSEGELCISGPSVLQGYWNRPEWTENAFLPNKKNERWYRTGDLVVEEPDGNYRFLGRKDRMVKKRGYRIELGEIEACLYRHPEIREAAVIALPDEEAGVRILAHLSARDGQRLSGIAMKQFCSEHVPVYMIPDAFRFHPSLPKTSTDKIDYQSLKSMN
ncbi:MAG: amino acid adenylation domain-containing protein [Planctomycetota bacterium]